MGYDPKVIEDLAFYIILAGIVGSRLSYVAANWSYYGKSPLEILMVWKGGLIWYGGFGLALLFSLWYLKRHHFPIWKTLDIFAPSLCIGEALGRLGCLSAGCCYGKGSALPWAITFTHPQSLAPLDVPLHPTQLYSSLQALIIFFILLFIKRFKTFEGELTWSYTLSYALFRFLIEMFRGDNRGWVAENLISLPQFLSIILFITSIFMLLHLKKGSKR